MHSCERMHLKRVSLTMYYVAVMYNAHTWSVFAAYNGLLLEYSAVAVAPLEIMEKCSRSAVTISFCVTSPHMCISDDSINIR